MPAVVHPFHLALPVHDVEKARAFYSGILNLPEVRKGRMREGGAGEVG